jgi:hypothetical protein
MYALIHSIVEKCELAFHKDATGWHLSARGALGVAALLIIVFMFARIFMNAGFGL